MSRSESTTTVENDTFEMSFEEHEMLELLTGFVSEDDTEEIENEIDEDNLYEIQNEIKE